MFKSREEILAECATVGVTPKTPVVLYCFKGARASNTLVALKEAGIENVTLYFGSWNEWSRDPSLPIETRTALQDRGRDQRRGLSARSASGAPRGLRTARLFPRHEERNHGHVRQSVRSQATSDGGLPLRPPRSQGAHDLPTSRRASMRARGRATRSDTRASSRPP